MATRYSSTFVHQHPFLSLCKRNDRATSCNEYYDCGLPRHIPQRFRRSDALRLASRARRRNKRFLHPRSFSVFGWTGKEDMTYGWAYDHGCHLGYYFAWAFPRYVEHSWSGLRGVGEHMGVSRGWAFIKVGLFLRSGAHISVPGRRGHGFSTTTPILPCLVCLVVSLKSCRVHQLTSKPLSCRCKLWNAVSRVSPHHYKP
jgi:hypothetical protein